MNTKEQSPGTRRRLPILIGVLTLGAIIFLCGAIFLTGVGAALFAVLDQRTGENQAASTHQRPVDEIQSALGSDQGQVSSIRGLVEKGTEGGSWAEVEDGQFISPGDQVRTGDLSGAIIELADGSQISLGSNTVLGIEELEVDTGGARRVVLNQTQGSSDHRVANNESEDGYYHVETPFGSAGAQGTRFQVLVSSDTGTDFRVLDGTVNVTSGDVSLILADGEMVTLNSETTDLQPFVMVSGQGQVAQIEPEWIIGDQTYLTHEGTVVLGGPQVGDLVQYQGHLTGDGGQLLDWIMVLHRAAVNQFSLFGIVDSTGPDSWVVSGQTVLITDTTVIDPYATAGSSVFITGMILEDGSLLANEVELLEGEQGLRFTFTGVVQEIGNTSWQVADILLVIDENTVINGEFSTGDIVQVSGWIQGDGTWLASSIEPANDLVPSFELVGELDGMDPWIVAGIEFGVNSYTVIDPGLSTGDLVRVSGFIHEDGEWIASSIEAVENERRLILIGRVFSIDPWIVGGVNLVTDGDTVIDGDVTVGILVRVEVVILDDGSWYASRITPIQWFGFGDGCVEITAVVVGVEGQQIFLASWPALQFGEDVQVEGDLQPGSVIRLRICLNEDGELIIVYIIVINEPEIIQEPGDGNGKVTVCHKPNGNNPHSITISQSALPAHLGHGDTVGACAGGKKKHK